MFCIFLDRVKINNYHTLDKIVQDVKRNLDLVSEFNIRACYNNFTLTRHYFEIKKLENLDFFYEFSRVMLENNQVFKKLINFRRKYRYLENVSELKFFDIYTKIEKISELEGFFNNIKKNKIKNTIEDYKILVKLFNDHKKPVGYLFNDKRISIYSYYEGLTITTPIGQISIIIYEKTHEQIAIELANLFQINLNELELLGEI